MSYSVGPNPEDVAAQEDNAVGSLARFLPVDGSESYSNPKHGGGQPWVFVAPDYEETRPKAALYGYPLARASRIVPRTPPYDESGRYIR